MKIQELRKNYINYFKKNGHNLYPSSSLIPSDDPTLLFANAGMNQFKDEFTGKSSPKDKRAVTIQKCVRAGGKHNDLENVGFTARHHTFFEMLGNFSFGDYFKKEAIQMAWDFLTNELKIPKDKLYITVHHTDQEAADIWHNQEKVPRENIFFRGDKDNFWEMGEIGPCGPSSEIFYDHGVENSDKDADTSECILDDESRYVEIWNLVFMQYEKYKEDGVVKRRELPKPCVDTGAGLERVAAVMQGVYNNFDTDAFSQILSSLEEKSGKKYKNEPYSFRVVADHARSATMLLSDGVIPSNEGRGYVLRRIIRRAVRYLDLIGVKNPVMYQLSTDVFDSLGEMYLESRKNLEFIQKYLKLEEESFRKTLASGLKLLEKKMESIKSKNESILSGKDAFLLYDTHGFPVDLTQMILKENKLDLDEDGFQKEMDAQKSRSKKAGNFSAGVDNSQEFYVIKEKKGESEFIGYDKLEAEASLIGKVNLGNKEALIFDKSVFYPEGGGQQGDIGEIFHGDTKVAQVLDTYKPVDGVIAHTSIVNGDFKIGEKYKLVVNKSNRDKVKANHTSTHLLQAALIKVLGNHIKQSGSSVSSTRLRFDFTHPEPLTKAQISQVEELVNSEIRNQNKVTPKTMTKDEALNSGAMALFGEKYGDEVRVIDIPGFSIELCGGTHVQNTADIGYFKILSESSLATGIRRIEAVSNTGAYKYIQEKLNVLERVETLFKAKDETLVSRVEQLQDNLQSSSKEIKALKEKLQAISAQNMFDGVTDIPDNQVFKHLDVNTDDDMRKLGDLFMNKYPNGVVLITQERGDKLGVLLKTFKKNSSIKCSDILRESVAKFAGKGGGKPDMAQGSVSTENKEELVSLITTRLI